MSDRTILSKLRSIGIKLIGLNQVEMSSDCVEAINHIGTLESLISAQKEMIAAEREDHLSTALALRDASMRGSNLKHVRSMWMERARVVRDRLLA